MLKKISIRLVAFLLLSALFIETAAAAPDSSASSVILIHADSGEVLYQKNADAQMLIASTTKIMTALVILEHCDPDDVVEISAESIAVEGSSMYLRAGEKLTVSDLLYGMLLVSGNDAASALAFHCSGSIEDFALLMNQKASELGLKNSSFKNPHGLDAEGHYSSAADLAQIMRAAMQIPLFAEIVSTKSCTINERTYINHNRLLWSYKGMLGGKTGYTMAAGRSLVTCAERDGLRLVCVTLSDPDDWDDHRAMYDWAFESFRYVSVMPSDYICRLPVISGEKDSVGIICKSENHVLVKSGAELNLSLELPEFVYAGVKENDLAGRAFVTADGVLVGEFPLLFGESVPLAQNAKLSPWQKLRRAWLMVNKYGLVINE